MSSHGHLPYRPQWRIFGSHLHENDICMGSCDNEWGLLSRLRGELWRRGIEDRVNLNCMSGASLSLAYVVQYVSTELIDIWFYISYVVDIDDRIRRELVDYQGQEGDSELCIFASRALVALPSEMLLVCLDQQSCRVLNQALTIYVRHWGVNFNGDSLVEGFASSFSEVHGSFYDPIVDTIGEDFNDCEKYIKLDRSDSRGAVRVLLKIWKQVRRAALTEENAVLCIWSKYV